MVNLVGVDPVSVVLELISRDDAEEVAGLLLRVMVQKHDIVSEFIANISQQRLLSGIVERDDFDDILDQLTRIRTERRSSAELEGEDENKFHDYDWNEEDTQSLQIDRMISKLPDEEEGKNKSLTNSEAFQNNLRQITSKLSQNSEKEKNKLNENEIEKGKEVQPGSNQDEIPKTLARESKFDQLLKDPGFLAKFVKFLKGEFSEENIEFWIACESYKNLPDANLESAAKAIFEGYIIRGAENELNIKHTLRMNLLEVYEEKKFPRTLFDEVQYEIYLLMLTDSFPRFLKTDLSLDTEEEKGTIKISLDLSNGKGTETSSQIKTLSISSTETCQQVIQKVLSKVLSKSNTSDYWHFYTMYFRHNQNEKRLTYSDLPLILKKRANMEESSEEPLFIMKDDRKEKSKNQELTSSKLTSKFRKHTSMTFSVSKKKRSASQENLFNLFNAKPDLEKQAAFDGRETPFIISDCIEAIEKKGLLIPGLYRHSGSSSLVKQLKNEFQSGRPNLDDPQWSDISVLTSLIKTYLQELQRPLITPESYIEFEESIKMEHQFGKVQGFQKAISTLSAVHSATLIHLILHLTKVLTQSEANKTNEKDLSFMFGAILIRHEADPTRLDIQLNLQASIISFMIKNSSTLFRSFKDYHRNSSESTEPLQTNIRISYARDSLEHRPLQVSRDDSTENVKKLALKLFQITDSPDFFNLTLFHDGQQRDLTPQETPFSIHQQLVNSGEGEPKFILLDTRPQETQQNNGVKSRRHRSLTFGTKAPEKLKIDKNMSIMENPSSDSPTTPTTPSSNSSPETFYSPRKSLGFKPFLRRTSTPNTRLSLPPTFNNEAGTLKIKNGDLRSEFVINLNVTLQDTQEVVILKAMDAFDLKDDTSLYFLAWANQEEKVVALSPNEIPLSFQNQHPFEITFILKKIPSLPQKSTESTSPKRSRERSRTFSTGLQNIFGKKLDDSKGLQQTSSSSSISSINSFEEKEKKPSPLKAYSTEFDSEKKIAEEGNEMGTIRLSLKEFSETDHYKTIAVNMEDTTIDVLQKAFEKYEISQNPLNYLLLMMDKGSERIIDASENPLPIKLETISKFNLSIEPTFSVISVKYAENKKKSRRRSELIPKRISEAFENFGNVEKVFLNVALEVTNTIVFSDEEFMLTSNDTFQNLIQKVLEQAQLRDSSDKWTVVMIFKEKENPIKRSDNIFKYKQKLRGPRDEFRFIVRKSS